MYDAMTGTISIGKTKRFLERWTSEPAFKKLVVEDPKQAMTKYGFDFHPNEIRLLWDRESVANSGSGPVPEPVRQYREFIREKLVHRDSIRDHSASKDARINGWRKRQMMRCRSQMGIQRHAAIVHAPFAVELSRGCSVGCWFCAYSAPKLSAIYRYTPENANLWQDVLATIKDVWGDGAKHGFCYWATEPLDNPDYELFLRDFFAILGVFPQTTTAVPMRDVARTRRLLELSQQHKGVVDRFSIHTLEKLEELYACFDADELQRVELLTQNKESDMVYANSGKVPTSREKAEGEISVNESTIACVSGFLFNMVDRTVQLITPCISGARWPRGYIIYDEAQFSTGDDLRTVLDAMVEKYMPLTVGYDTQVRFRSDLQMQIEPQGFSLHLKQPSFANAAPHPFFNSPKQVLHAKLSALGTRIAENRWTAGELAHHFELTEYIPAAETFHCLNLLLSFGLLQEGPE